jgi:hypothetical protein
VYPNGRQPQRAPDGAPLRITNATALSGPPCIGWCNSVRPASSCTLRRAPFGVAWFIKDEFDAFLEQPVIEKILYNLWLDPQAQFLADQPTGHATRRACRTE